MDFQESPTLLELSTFLETFLTHPPPGDSEGNSRLEDAEGLGNEACL